MTTNVYDRDGAVLASDSRWSAISPCKKYLLFTDDAKFDKIFVADEAGLAFAFTGDANYVAQYKDWLLEGAALGQTLPPIPKTAKFTFFSVSVDTGTIDHHHFPDSFLPTVVGANDLTDLAKIEALFAGTGARIAHLSWLGCRDHEEAILDAIEVDHQTGGEIIFTCLKSFNHNATVGSAAQLLAALKEGTVMELVHMTYANPRPVADVVDIPEVAALVGGLASGSMVASAPFPGMGVAEFSDEKIAETEAYLARLQARLQSRT